MTATNRPSSPVGVLNGAREYALETVRRLSSAIQESEAELKRMRERRAAEIRHADALVEAIISLNEKSAQQQEKVG